MKYENFEKVKELCDHISKLQSYLDDLRRYPVIKIIVGNSTLFSINGYASTDQHNFEKFPKYAISLINEIITDLMHRIDIDNEILEDL